MAEYDDPQSEVVDVNPDGKKPKTFVYDEESPNLVADFKAHPEGVTALAEIASRVVRDFDADYEASAERRSQFKKDWAIFSGILPKKTFPFAEAANTHVPIALENTTRNVFRGFSELFGDWDDVFGVAPLGPNDEEVAKLLTLHGNWQLRNQIPDFKRQQARGFLLFFFLGDVSAHSYWNAELEQNRHETLSLDEFVIPYVYTSTMPDYSDLTHRTKVMFKYRHELQALRAQWEDVDKIIADNIPGLDDEPESMIANEMAKSRGQSPEVGDEKSPPNAPYKMLWYEGWLSLPNQENDRFCKVVLDYKTKTVVELLILEHPDWQDVQRFESQMQELLDYRTQMVSFQQARLQQQSAIQEILQESAAAQGMMGPDQASAVAQGIAQAQNIATQLQPPAPPAWSQSPDDPNEKPAPAKRKPIHLFSHGVLIEPLVGGIGLGYGTMQCDFNRAANTALAQFTDQATLSNIGCFIGADIVQLPEQLDIAPGKIIKIQGVGPDELEKALVPIKFGPANPQLIEVVDKMYGYGSSSMQSPSVLSGDPGKSGETFRGITARIEQATKQLSVSTRSYADPFLCQILRNNALLNSIYLKDEELFHVAEARGQIPQQMTVGRRMYERNYHVEIRADLRFLSQSQRVQEADELAMMVKQFPQLAQNQAFCYMVIKKMLQARKQDDMVAVLGTMPPPPPVFGAPPMPPPGMPGMPGLPPGAAPPGVSGPPPGIPGMPPGVPIPGRAA